MQLGDKVALITGAGSGIGQASAILLAREGGKIAALDLTEEQLGDTIQAIEGDSGQVMPVAADVSQPEQVQRAVEQVIDKWGRLDVVFANAGINGVWAPIEDLEPDEWDRTLDINLKGTFLTVKYAVPYLKKQGGSVIITSSVNGTRNFSNTGATAYSCSKAAQVTFAQMVALELAPHKVRVNVICPGAVETRIEQNTQQRDTDEVKIPVIFPEGTEPLTDGRPATSDQVARVVLFLASDASDHVSGSPIWIDGAASLLVG